MDVWKKKINAKSSEKLFEKKEEHMMCKYDTQKNVNKLLTKEICVNIGDILVYTIC